MEYLQITPNNDLHLFHTDFNVEWTVIQYFMYFINQFLVFLSSEFGYLV